MTSTATITKNSTIGIPSTVLKRGSASAASRGYDRWRMPVFDVLVLIKPQSERCLGQTTRTLDLVTERIQSVDSIGSK
jgi:hypothetical protein